MQPIEASILCIGAATPRRGEMVGEVIVVLGDRSLGATPDKADEKRAQRGETGGCYGD